MQIPILNGIYTDSNADYRTSYPRNLIPVPKVQGVSKGYLRPAEGLIQFDTTACPGIDRGGFNWKGVLYRVMGTKLVSVAEDGTVSTLGDVGSGGQVVFNPSFDVLGIAASNRLFFWDGAALTENTDLDLGVVLSMIWIDGFFMTTDGENIVVTELNDRYAVNPLKYGSSEVDPDPIEALLKLKNEAYALNRETIEVFDNIGGNLFPFQRIEGAQIQKGVIGPNAGCIFIDKIAFLGNGRNEAPSVYLGANSQTEKIATREIDQILQQFTEAQLAQVVLEAKVDKGHQHLLMHLPDQTWVFDAAATRNLEELVWFKLNSSVVGESTYKARNFIWCYNKWISGDPTQARLAYSTPAISSQYAETIGWDFSTVALYNEGRGAIVHDLELVCLPGRVPLGADPVVWQSYSTDGETWSQEIACPAGKQGEYNSRINWLEPGIFDNTVIHKFRGTSDCFVSFARLEARVEGLAF